MNVGLNARGSLLGVRANVLVKVSTNESLSKRVPYILIEFNPVLGTGHIDL